MNTEAKQFAVSSSAFQVLFGAAGLLQFHPKSVNNFIYLLQICLFRYQILAPRMLTPSQHCLASSSFSFSSSSSSKSSSPSVYSNLATCTQETQVKILPSESYLQIPCHSNAKRLDYVRLVSHPWQRSQNVLAVPFKKKTQPQIHTTSTRFGPVLSFHLFSWMYFTIKKNTESESRNGLASPLGTFSENTKTHLSPTKLFWRSGQDGRSCVQFKTLTHDGSMGLVRIFIYLHLA